jgi:hypothetical protein
MTDLLLADCITLIDLPLHMVGSGEVDVSAVTGSVERGVNDGFAPAGRRHRRDAQLLRDLPIVATGFDQLDRLQAHLLSPGPAPRIHAAALRVPHPSRVPRTRRPVTMALPGATPTGR